MNIYGIVLASGRSIRMGQPKLLLPWKGRPMLEHVLSKMKGIPFSDVKVVVSSQNPELEKAAAKFAYSIVKNNTPEQGMGHSLSLAIQTLPMPSEAAVIVLGDQPTIAAEDIGRICLAFKQLRAGQAAPPKVIMQMQYRDGRVGHPVLFSHHFFSELRHLSGDKGGKEIIQRNACSRSLCFSDNPYPNDIDTPDDYHQLWKGEENE
ncbi:NTP transferase domain-containing protein [Bacillus benzoevorans]|uniref:Molybdenum cofactor cytidylyltransferase n=1 Tax=Bacillus benzoevorans TaxID=1456 RepID=A0A7X0HTW0_9BACI|nr:molybdenum cofactor cytidylyltransferase [Bacillus benzoevorans]